MTREHFRIDVRRLRAVLAVLRRTLSLALLTTACAASQAVPPEPAPPGMATFVSASFDLTWTAALDRFAESAIPVATIDRASGELTTERVDVTPAEAIEYADCGSTGAPGNPSPYPASSVVYRVVVLDEGRSSTILVTASWDALDRAAPFPCETTRVRENELQEDIRLAAEANR